MRHVFVAAIFASVGFAQTGPVVPATGDMPGKPVGQPSVQPVGSKLPSVGTTLPKVGTSPGQAGGANAPFNNSPVDPNLVIAPYPGQKSPALDFWDRLQDRWAKLFAPPAPPPTTFVPGIYRRNRERHQRELALQEWRMRD